MSDDAIVGEGAYGAIDRVLRVFEFIALLVAAAFLLAAMLLISADALFRYIFNNPLVFQLTVTEDYLLIGIVMMSLAWGFRTGGYIRISGLANLLPAVSRNLLLRAGVLASAGYAAVLCWQSWGHFWSAFITSEVKYGVIDYPVWLSHVWVPTGLGLLALRLTLTAVGPVQNLNVEHDPTEEI